MTKNFVYRAGLVGLLGCMALGLTGCPWEVVFIPDQALDSAIRASINKPLGFLTKADLLDVTEIQASGLGIHSLDGIENCLNLTRANFKTNQIQSITPLEGLANLVWLDLGANYITDITPVSGLFYLENLDLHGDDNDIRIFMPLVANALAGGIGAGTTVTLSPEWTVQTDGTFFPDFQDIYLALIDAGVTVIFAESSGSGVVR